MDINKLIEQEGNQKDGTYKGLHWEILRHSYMKHLCGYIDIPLNNKLSKVENLEFIKQEVTYDRIENDNRRIGFDCAHSGMFIPAHPEMGGTYWDMCLCENTIKDTIDKWMNI